MAWRSYRKGLAIVGVFLFLMGVVVPAVFGLMTEKAMDLGVGDLLDKSTNWDASNIANSTYFVDKYVRFYAGDGQVYAPGLVYDADNDIDVVMLSRENPISTHSFSEHAKIIYALNATALDSVDKIVVDLRLLDTQPTTNITAAGIWLGTGSGYSDIKIENINVTTLASENRTVVEVPIDVITRLKIQQDADGIVYLSVYTKGNVTDVVEGVRVELYDVKKVNATAASNIMLAVSGVLGWLGALAATPYWNPYANREHRNVRRVGHAIRRRIPRRRR